VRHHLVQRIIRAYDEAKAIREAQMQLSLGAKTDNGSAGSSAQPEPAEREQESRIEDRIAD
jgi:hypothetical protein